MNPALAQAACWGFVGPHFCSGDLVHIMGLDNAYGPMGGGGGGVLWRSVALLMDSAVKYDSALFMMVYFHDSPLQ